MYIFTPFFTAVYIVERLILQTLYVHTKKEILWFFSQKSAVSNQEQVIMACVRYIVWIQYYVVRSKILLARFYWFVIENNNHFLLFREYFSMSQIYPKQTKSLFQSHVWVWSTEKIREDRRFQHYSLQNCFDILVPKPYWILKDWLPVTPSCKFFPCSWAF